MKPTTATVPKVIMPKPRKSWVGPQVSQAASGWASLAEVLALA